MSRPTTPRLTPALLTALGFVLLPAAFFYAVVFRMIVNLPFADDYDILLFTLHQRTLPSLSARALYALTAQHNEYKLMLANTIFTLQYEWLGHVNFAALCFVGDLSVLLLGAVLWKMFLPDLQDIGLRLALFLPASWLLFQLSYAETLNWAEPTIQNLYILTFSVGSFMLLVRSSRRSMAASVVFLILAIMASANGFITAFVGSALLLHTRRWRHLAAWLFTSAGMMLLYAYRYNSMSSQSNQGHSVFATLLHIHLGYVLSFLGSLGYFVQGVGHISAITGSLVLGTLLVLFFLYESRQGRLTTNPAVFATIVFILLTGVGVAGLRSDLGAWQSLAQRYRVYCSLLLVMAWFILAEKYLQRSRKVLIRNPAYLAACAFAILFSLALDRSGIHYLQARRAMLIEGMSLYQHRNESHSVSGPLFVDGSHFIVRSPEENVEARRLLQLSAEAGIYQPPHD